MQQIELFTVATILWGGVFVFLLYLYLKMEKIEEALKAINISLEEDN